LGIGSYFWERRIPGPIGRHSLSSLKESGGIFDWCIEAFDTCHRGYRRRHPDAGVPEAGDGADAGFGALEDGHRRGDEVRLMIPNQSARLSRSTLRSGGMPVWARDHARARRRPASRDGQGQVPLTGITVLAKPYAQPCARVRAPRLTMRPIGMVSIHFCGLC
jgi:hypothetical protein